MSYCKTTTTILLDIALPIENGFILWAMHHGAAGGGRVVQERSGERSAIIAGTVQYNKINIYNTNADDAHHFGDSPLLSARS